MLMMNENRRSRRIRIFSGGYLVDEDTSGLVRGEVPDIVVPAGDRHQGAGLGHGDLGARGNRQLVL